MKHPTPCAQYQKRYGWLYVLLLLFISTHFGSAADNVPSPQEQGGSVCFVIYAPKQLIEKLDRQAVITIDGVHQSPLLGKSPRIIANDLDLRKKHVVKVKLGDQVWFSDTFRFKPNSTLMNLWRGGGNWHLEPALSDRCELFPKGLP